MRLKNVKGASEKIKDSSYIIEDSIQYKGKFHELFRNQNKIYIEIGMGKGNFIIENALRYPNINFIGIEKYDSVLVRATQKLEQINIPNLKLIRFDATRIEELFDGEVDRIYLNFSDPWPKARHEKRRLTSHIFLKRYDSIFKATKSILLKTDNRKLFEYSIISLTEYGYHIKNLSLDLYKDDIEDNIQTEYEIKFHELGYPIYQIEVYKD